jgi:hypothetical protein
MQSVDENKDSNIIAVASEEETTMPSTLVLEGFGFTKKEAKVTKEGLRGYYRWVVDSQVPSIH